MFFERDLISFNLLDVLELKQENVSMWNSGRNFNALSFRFKADSVLKTETTEHHMKDNSIAYVPARLDYGRRVITDDLIVAHFETTNYRTRCIETFIPKEPEKLAVLFRGMLECWNKKKVGYKYECSALLCKIFAECHAQNFKESAGNSKIKASVDYMMQNFKDPNISIAELAKKSFVSEVYFRKLFKAEFGTSPQKHIIKLRIQNAVGLISAGYYSLEEVAYMSGYNDYKYFSVEFKRIIGVSPSEYRYNYENQK